MITNLEDPVAVHVINPEDMKGPVQTEEKEAQHYTCSSFTLPQGEIIGTGVGAIEPTQILQLDPLRKRAVIGVNGSGQVILAHSLQQATSLAQNIQQAADEGALFTAPCTLTAEATGPLWAVGLSTSLPANGNNPSTPVSVTGAANATATAATPPPAAGEYASLTSLSYSFSAASTSASTLTVTSSGTLFTLNIPVGALSGTIPLPPGGIQGAVATAISVALTAAGAGITGTVNISYQQSASSVIQVGVAQERRNS